MNLREEISAIIQRRIQENGWDQAFKAIAPLGGFSEAVKERILVVLIKHIEELETKVEILTTKTKEVKEDAVRRSPEEK